MGRNSKLHSMVEELENKLAAEKMNIQVGNSLHANDY